MTSRERIIETINHRQPDRVPIDFGSTGQTGISVSALSRLRDYLKLEKKTVDVSEIVQMLGYVDEDLRQVMKSDVIGLNHPEDSLGIYPDGSKTLFTMPDGTQCYMNSGNHWTIREDGAIFMYPQGDTSVSPSLHMPANGYFFDATDRYDPINEDTLTPREDFKDFFSVIDDCTARYYETESLRLYEETDYAIIGNLSGAGYGDPGAIPGVFEKHPRGIRKFEDWCMALALYPDYIHEVFEMQTEFMLKNLEIYRQAVGDRIQICWVSGTDFGAQNGLLISKEMFENLYKPYYVRICNWIHTYTNWKTYFHCCGSITALLDDFVDMGVDILNPVQLSAVGMDARMLKDKYGEKLVFWGGGVDTQHTLTFGTPEEVYDQVIERLRIFAPGGGYVFNTIHNILGNTPAENIQAAFQAVHDFNEK